MTTAARPRLLKLSGEVFGGPGGVLDPGAIQRICVELDTGVRGAPVAVVVGGGNILRGASVRTGSSDPTCGDYIGMLGTLINGLALKEGLARLGRRCEVMAPQGIANVARTYDRQQALSWLAEGVILVFAGGTGHPFLTTDTAAALRAAEIGAGELLKGSKVDGIYSADPKKDPTAKRFDTMTYQQAIDGRFAVMDLSAFELCRDRDISIRVFDMTAPGTIAAALGPHPPGTLVRGAT